MDNPDLFCHVSTPAGVARIPRAIAELGGLTPLGEATRPRTARTKPRVRLDAVTPTPNTEAEASGDSEENA